MRGVELRFHPLGDMFRGEKGSQTHLEINSGIFSELLVNFLFSLMNESNEAHMKKYNLMGESNETSMEKYNSFVMIPEKKKSNLNLGELSVVEIEKGKNLSKSIEEGEKDPIFLAILLIGKEIFNEIISRGNVEDLNLEYLKNKLSFYLWQSSYRGEAEGELREISNILDKREVKGELREISEIIENIANKEGYSNEAQKFVKNFFEQTKKLLSFSEAQFDSPAISKFINGENFYGNDNKVHLSSLGEEELLSIHKVSSERSIQEEAFFQIKKIFEELPSAVKEEIKNFFERKASYSVEDQGIKTFIEEDKEEIFYFPKGHFKEAYSKFKEIDLKTSHREFQESFYTVQEVPIKALQTARAESGSREVLQTFMKIGVERISEFIKDIVIETSPSGEKKAFVQLEPPELGRMELDLKVHDGEVEIQIKVEREETFHYLREEFSHMREHIEDLGLRVKDFQIFLGLTTSEGKHFSEDERRKSLKGSDEGVPLEELDQKVVETSFYHRGILYRIV